jgi:hypothetical protein
MPKLTWSSTGDEIDLIPYNSDLYYYFVDNLNLCQLNQYRSGRLDLDLDELPKLIDNIGKVFTEKFKIDFLKISNTVFDQQELNRLHKEWIELHIKYPNLHQILTSINPELSSQLNRINTIIHTVEEFFDKLVFNTQDSNKNFQNIFGAEVLTFETVNVFIKFNNLGRSTYNKWLNFDDNAVDIDTNDFNEIYTQLAVTFKRPSGFVAPDEYQTWARQHGTCPFGRTLALANFDNLQTNLLKYREMFYKNLQIENNYFTLKE